MDAAVITGKINEDRLTVTNDDLSTSTVIILIRDTIAAHTGRPVFTLDDPMILDNAFSDSSSPSDSPIMLSQAINLVLHDPRGRWSSCSVTAILSPSLCADMILGMPFVYANFLVTDVNTPSLIDRRSGFDLLHPTPLRYHHPNANNDKTPSKVHYHNDYNTMLNELRSEFPHISSDLRECYGAVEHGREACVAAALRTRIEELALLERCQNTSRELKSEFVDIFEPLPHVDLMQGDVRCSIN
ncbi:hypothetical protein MPER_08244 [Moniliophthora perniciosa FA553]|nr:hypothetical protein MPER_08244 [Moniliophthora perniciosa FA553]